MNMGRDYAQDAFYMAKEHLPSSHQLAKSKMKADAKLAKGVTKALPAKVKRMELAKLVVLPLAGALVGLLFAPKSGKEMRTDIKHKITDMKDASMEKEHEWKEKGVEKIHELKEQHADTADTGHRTVEHSYESALMHGNVHGTAAEPTEDQTIPADKLDETLDDLGYSSEEELLEEDNK